MESIDTLAKLLESEVYGNGVAEWALAALLSAAILIVGLLARFVLVRRLPSREPGQDLHLPVVLHEAVSRTWTLFLIIAAIYAGTALLTLPESVHRLVYVIFIVALFVQVALWADCVASAVLTWRLTSHKKAKAAMRNALALIQFIARVAIWSLALLLIFQNLGFDITALIAGLGVGGIAVALAAQSVLGDLFASLAIILDRPFEVGDFVVFGDQMGTVEKIGIKTTRIRALTGEQIAVANSDLVATRVHNFKRMAERRVVLVLGVTYDTPADKLERIPSMVQKIVEAQDGVRFDRAHFRGFGASALEFEIVYWVLSAEYNVYMDRQQDINFAIFRAFEDEEIAFAFPSQTLYVPDLKAALSAIGKAPGGEPGKA